MKAITIIAVAIILILPVTAPYAEADDTIGISSLDELMSIGTEGYPLNGNYRQLNDIVLTTSVEYNLKFERNENSFSVTLLDDDKTVTTESETIIRFNSYSKTINNGTVTSVFSLLIMDVNTLWISLGDKEIIAFPTDSDIINSVTIPSSATVNFIPVKGTFTGTYDGLGHSIIGLTSISETPAIFEKTNNATILNLSVRGTFISLYDINSEKEERSDLIVKSYASSLVGEASYTTFERITIKSDVLSMVETHTLLKPTKGEVTVNEQRIQYSGGICGKSSNCSYLSCTTEGSVSSSVIASIDLSPSGSLFSVNYNGNNGVNTSSSTTGGLTGLSENDKFAFCNVFADVSSSSSIKCEGTTHENVNSISDVTLGGLIGSVYDSTIFGSTFVGSIGRSCSSSINDVNSLTSTEKMAMKVYSGGIAGKGDSLKIDSCHIDSETGWSTIYGYEISGGVIGKVVDCSEILLKNTLIDSIYRDGGSVFGSVDYNFDSNWNKDSWIYRISLSDKYDTADMIIAPNEHRYDISYYRGITYPWRMTDSGPSIFNEILLNLNISEYTSGWFALSGEESNSLLLDGCSPSLTYESTFGDMEHSIILKDNMGTLTLQDKGIDVLTYPTFNWSTLKYDPIELNVTSEYDTYWLIAIILTAISAIVGLILLIANVDFTRRYPLPFLSVSVSQETSGTNSEQQRR